MDIICADCHCSSILVASWLLSALCGAPYSHVLLRQYRLVMLDAKVFVQKQRPDLHCQAFGGLKSKPSYILKVESSDGGMLFASLD